MVADLDGSNADFIPFIDLMLVGIVDSRVVADYAAAADVNCFEYYHRNAHVWESIVAAKSGCRTSRIALNSSLAPRRQSVHRLMKSASFGHEF